VPAAITGAFMLGAHAFLWNGAWGLDLLGSGLAGALVYFTCYLLFGLTPTEKGALMRLLERSPA
jgi:hypothetical protein